MIIEVIVCRPDGTQELEQREVAENWFDNTTTEQAATGQSEAAE